MWPSPRSWPNRFSVSPVFLVVTTRGFPTLLETAGTPLLFAFSKNRIAILAARELSFLHFSFACASRFRACCRYDGKVALKRSVPVDFFRFPPSHGLFALFLSVLVLGMKVSAMRRSLVRALLVLVLPFLSPPLRSSSFDLGLGTRVSLLSPCHALTAGDFYAFTGITEVDSIYSKETALL